MVPTPGWSSYKHFGKLRGSYHALSIKRLITCRKMAKRRRKSITYKLKRWVHNLYK